MHQILFKNKSFWVKEHLTYFRLSAFMVLFVMSNVVVGKDDNLIDTADVFEIAQEFIGKKVSIAQEFIGEKVSSAKHVFWSMFDNDGSGVPIVDSAPNKHLTDVSNSLIMTAANDADKSVHPFVVASLVSAATDVVLDQQQVSSVDSEKLLKEAKEEFTSVVPSASNVPAQVVEELLQVAMPAPVASVESEIKKSEIKKEVTPVAPSEPEAPVLAAEGLCKEVSQYNNLVQSTSEQSTVNNAPFVSTVANMTIDSALAAPADSEKLPKEATSTAVTQVVPEGKKEIVSQPSQSVRQRLINWCFQEANSVEAKRIKREELPQAATQSSVASVESETKKEVTFVVPSASEKPTQVAEELPQAVTLVPVVLLPEVKKEATPVVPSALEVPAKVAEELHQAVIPVAPSEPEVPAKIVDELSQAATTVTSTVAKQDIASLGTVVPQAVNVTPLMGAAESNASGDVVKTETSMDKPVLPAAPEESNVSTKTVQSSVETPQVISNVNPADALLQPQDHQASQSNAVSRAVNVTPLKGAAESNESDDVAKTETSMDKPVLPDAPEEPNVSTKTVQPSVEAPLVVSNVNPADALLGKQDLQISEEEGVASLSDKKTEDDQKVDGDKKIESVPAPVDAVVASDDDSMMSWLYISGGVVTASLIAYKMYNYLQHRMASPQRLVAAIIATTDRVLLQSIYADIVDAAGVTVVGHEKPKLTSVQISSVMLLVEELHNMQRRQIMIAVMLHKFEISVVDQIRLIKILKETV